MWSNIYARLVNDICINAGVSAADIALQMRDVVRLLSIATHNKHFTMSAIFGVERYADAIEKFVLLLESSGVSIVAINIIKMLLLHFKSIDKVLKIVNFIHSIYGKIDMKISSDIALDADFKKRLQDIFYLRFQRHVVINDIYPKDRIYGMVFAWDYKVVDLSIAADIHKTALAIRNSMTSTLLD